MARPQEYDRDQVLESAMEVFRQQGYGATSVPNLVAATGLQPGSLYAAFGNKKGLLLEALKAYSDKNLVDISKALTAKSSAFESLCLFLEQTADSCKTPAGNHGCLMLNMLLEMSSQDDDIDQLLQQLIGRIETRLTKQFELAISQGEIAEDQNPAALAKFVLTNIWGLRILGRQNKKAQDTGIVVDQVIAYLRSCSSKAA